MTRPHPRRAGVAARRPGVRTAPTQALDIVAVAVEPTQATVQPDGEIDFTNAGLVAAALREQLALGHRFVRLDLSRLTFLDCAGLRVIVEAHNEFLYASGTLVLTGVGARVARLLRLTDLDKALYVADEPSQPPRVRHLSSVPTGATR